MYIGNKSRNMGDILQYEGKFKISCHSGVKSAETLLSTFLEERSKAEVLWEETETRHRCWRLSFSAVISQNSIFSIQVKTFSWAGWIVIHFKLFWTLQNQLDNISLFASAWLLAFSICLFQRANLALFSFRLLLPQLWFPKNSPLLLTINTKVLAYFKK